MAIKEIEQKYDNILKCENVLGDFDITDDLCATVYFKYIYPSTSLQYVECNTRRKITMLSRQLNYTRLSLLRVKYMRNGYKASGIKEGFVYLITNPAWSEYMKIGSAIDVTKRLSSYQTYSPYRDYELVRYYFSHDRFKEEKMYHQMMPSDGEWCKGDLKSISALFASKKLHSIELLKDYCKFDCYGIRR